MKSLLRLLTTLVLSFASIASFSQTQNSVQTWGRNYSFPCGYPSEHRADLVVNYTNPEIDPSTQVTLIYDFEGKEWLSNQDGARWVPFGWSHPTLNNKPRKRPLELPLQQNEEGHWGAKLAFVLNQRGRPSFVTGVNFVLKLRSYEFSDGVAYVKGSFSRFGFYRTDDSAFGGPPQGCVSEETPTELYPAFRRLNLNAIIKN